MAHQSQVQNTTDLLNFLLSGYDKRLRPGFRGKLFIELSLMSFFDLMHFRNFGQRATTSSPSAAAAASGAAERFPFFSAS
jgi:hypothetical protein